MASKFYLHDAATSDTGTLPSAQVSTVNFANTITMSAGGGGSSGSFLNGGL